jgi:TRAP-type C4-dicarboxylate transport system permease small subunit
VAVEGKPASETRSAVADPSGAEEHGPRIELTTGKRTGVLQRIAELLLGACLIALVALVTYAVVARYILNQSIAFSDELSRLLFIWLVFLGSAVALQREEHLGVRLLHKRMPPRLRRAVDLGGGVATLALTLVLLWQGIDATRQVGFQRLPVMRVSAAWMYAAVPVSGLLMTWYALVNLVRSVRGGGRDEQAEDFHPDSFL